MAGIAVRAERISKYYRIGEVKEQYLTLVDTLSRAIRAPLKRFRRLSGSASHEMFCALDRITFDLSKGEILGIIGANGAGKSTLLKILSRITAPTSGRAELFGRMGSLLEVGTGFHPELTGRENIYLNGAILGMRKGEINRRFDEIVAFSEIEKFLDTPVKRYSSGMYVRLAFSVAAHLESEILLVDEVLAVGDIGFRNKCLGKMSDVTRAGRTVIFVSHDMAAVSKLCSKGIFLDRGRIELHGDIDECVNLYTKSFFKGRSSDLITIPGDRFVTDSRYRIVDLEILGRDRKPLDYVRTGDFVCFRIHYHLDRSLANPGFRLMIFSQSRVELLRISTDPISGFHVPPLPAGEGFIDATIESFPFTAGMYAVDVGITRVRQDHPHDVQGAAVIHVQGGDVYGSGFQMTTRLGFFTCDHEWVLGQVQ
ncbi:ABC transporter ATP-binding protein [Thermodesulfobacteriota bacterium]